MLTGLRSCVVDVLPGYPVRDGEPSVIVLGTRLLSKYRTGFDVDNREMGCEFFKSLATPLETLLLTT